MGLIVQRGWLMMRVVGIVRRREKQVIQYDSVARTVVFIADLVLC